MRTVRRILLVAEDDDAVAPMRFVIKNTSNYTYTRCYAVATSHNAIEAMGFLAKERFDLVLLVLPVNGYASIIENAKLVDDEPRIVVMAEDDFEVPSADAFLYQAKMERLLWTIKELTENRKHGPRKGSPEAMRCGENKRRLRIAA